MSSYEAETLRLMDALPIPGDRGEMSFHGDCPLAFDASGSADRVFQVAATDTAVAAALHYGEAHVSITTQERLAREAQFNDPNRVGEHISCLLMRAKGLCVQYDAANNRNRTEEEARIFLRSAAHE